MTIRVFKEMCTIYKTGVSSNFVCLNQTICNKEKPIINETDRLILLNWVSMLPAHIQSPEYIDSNTGSPHLMTIK